MLCGEESLIKPLKTRTLSTFSEEKVAATSLSWAAQVNKKRGSNGRKTIPVVIKLDSFLVLQTLQLRTLDLLIEGEPTEMSSAVQGRERRGRISLCETVGDSRRRLSMLFKMKPEIPSEKIYVLEVLGERPREERAVRERGETAAVGTFKSDSVVGGGSYVDASAAVFSVSWIERIEGGEETFEAREEGGGAVPWETSRRRARCLS